MNQNDKALAQRYLGRTGRTGMGTVPLVVNGGLAGVDGSESEIEEW